MSVGDADPANGTEPSTAKVFISYSRRDLDFADRVDAALKARRFDTLIDRSDIYALEDWWQRIESLIVQADTIVFVLSPDAVASEVCQSEVRFAASLNKRLAPIVCRQVDDKAVPAELARLNFIFFDDPARFDASIDRLAEALETDIDWVRKHTEFGEHARRWMIAGRPGPRGLLLRPPALDEAERWIASRPQNAPMPTEAAQAFIAASRRAHTRRRNIVSASLAAGLFVALGLAGIALWQRHVAVEQQKIAQAQRVRAEQTLALATTTANDLVHDLAQKFRDSGVPTAVIQDILQRARKLQDQLTAGGEISPALRDSQAAALTEVARELITIGDPQGALSAARRAKEISQSLLNSYPGNFDYESSVAVSDYQIGAALRAQGDPDGAVAAYRDGVAVMKTFAAQLPQSDYGIRGVMSGETGVGDMLMGKGDNDGALAAYRDAAAIAKTLVQNEPDDEERQHLLAGLDSRIGLILNGQGHFDEALAAHNEALAISRALVQKNPGNTMWRRDLYGALTAVALVQKAERHFDEALATLHEAQNMIEALARTDPDNNRWQDDLGRTYDYISDVQMAQRHPDDALATFSELREIVRGLLQKHPENTHLQRVLASITMKVGDATRMRGDLAAALIDYRDSLAMFTAIAAKNPADDEPQESLWYVRDKIGDVSRAQGDTAGSLAAYHDAFAIAKTMATKEAKSVDWQIHFAVSLYKEADAGEDPRANLTTALATLNGLRAAKTLPPDNELLLTAVETALAKLPN